MASQWRYIYPFTRETRNLLYALLLTVCNINHPPGKNQRLKEAKEEAAREIEDYRKERDQKFQDDQKKFHGSKDNFQQKMKQETSVKLQKIEQEVSDHKEEVIGQLLKLVYDIKPELHINYREGKGQQAA